MVINKYIEDIIKNDDAHQLKQYLQQHVIDFHNEAYLYYALSYRSFPCFVELMKIIQIENKEAFFIQCASSSLPIALAYLEYNSFETDNHMSDYEHYSLNNLFFTEKSLLSRYFSPIIYQNNKEAFLANLMYSSLRTIAPSDIEVLTYLLEHRKELGILDKHIVQYFIEGEGKFYFDTIENERTKTILSILLDYNVDFSIDKSGLIIQICAIHHLSDMINSVYEQGSSIHGFIDRYKNKENWLNEAEKNELSLADCNYDRVYDVYKKFDSDNCASDLFLYTISSILEHQKLKSTLPEKISIYDMKTKI